MVDRKFNCCKSISYHSIYHIINAKYITHCGYGIENNIASDIRLSRNVVNKESKSSWRFVCYCDTSSGDKNYCKQGSVILYGRTGGAVYNSIDNWNNNAQCLLVDAHGDRPIVDFHYNVHNILHYKLKMLLKYHSIMLGNTIS